ncbi:MAG TPA: FAD-dependent oxidoreductase, partial [Longimicrobiaceae bacterium]|nr:FAD-dependent oxidoreductase [Longimicrobiaceae bacterium]
MSATDARRVDCQCCIAGGGPAGLMLAALLARQGVRVVVLEKHADFLRDFRGDTIHPSTLEVLEEMGLLDAFLERPHQRLSELQAIVGGEAIRVADFSRLPTRCRFIALMPQWDFLDFLRDAAERHDNFQIRMRSEVVGLIRDDDRVVGVRVATPEGPVEVRADLVVGADGRHSVVRREAGLPATDLGAPIDVLWMRISRHERDPGQALGRIESGRILITLDRGSYWQCAFVIPKGTWEDRRPETLRILRAEIARVAPFLRDRVEELDDWEQVKRLTVRVDRLVRWHRPGLLCIGDAAHAMSPIGGVGINLAVQDAVAAANLLGRALAAGEATEADLKRVQRRRMLPTRVTQRVQLFAQDFGIRPVL